MPTRGSSPANRAADQREAELVERIREGDVSALEIVFSAYSVPLCTYALTLVRSHEQAADVVHDVFLWIWARRDRFDVRESLQAYLYRATRNRALNLLKRESLEQRWMDEASHEHASIPIPDAVPVGEMLERRELAAAVERVAEDFPERRRMVFLLRWREGLRYAEIAERLGISQKTVENQMTRALRVLRTRLATYLD